jgi:hypothetical protein
MCQRLRSGCGKRLKETLGPGNFISDSIIAGKTGLA